MRFQLLALALLFSVLATRLCGQTPDDKYLKIYSLLEEADKLGGAGDTRQAVPKYLEVQNAIKELQASNPDWNSKLLTYRLDYISSRLEALTKKAATNLSPATVQSETSEQAATRQLKALQGEISRLAAQNSLLEAKLREALSVQPAAADPRELTKAEERIKALQKERDLLAVSLEQAAARQASTATKDPTADTRRELVTQGAVVSVLQKQNEDLLRQISALSQKLKKDKAPEAGRETLGMRETIAELEARNRVMREEQAAMENRLLDFVRRHGASSGKEKELETQLVAARAAAATAERQRDELIEKLNGVTRELNQRDSQVSPAKTQQLEQQLEAIRAKLQIFEAKAVPYTAEELALFKQAPVKVAGEQTNSPLAAKRESLPAATKTLVAEAQRAVEGGRLDEAERKYGEALKQDESNLHLLANLAAVQLDQDKMGEAEGTLKKALAVDAQDAASLCLLGDLKLRQEKNGEALEALSRSAQIAPEVAQTQYYLGKAFIQSGDRASAQTALRKAVHLKPGWGDAHYLLAVLYAAEEPNFSGLAQYHYKKAIGGGASRNLELEQMMQRRTAKP